ncbi:hypothetical protein MAPG_03844 [Magnaporthiopsis poae ATCC 64411]|uniref:DUF676 domain-containing protein n=1 Tax=Magnaporthiopsis poae (strain ATCC 64411 / 73-15) TaxID=644358 RepID=A0A0C4DV44_MAGP6|nr:hypothetical protein MAPG_03844 [Magnaporthiopsis poae ATCC 64411]
MGTINKQPNRYDVSAVYTHPDAEVDIVLVHGLNGEPKRTWTAKDNGVYWPADLLPASLKGRHANILVYGYNADVYSNRKDKSPSDNFIHVHAQTLVAKLSVYRRSEETTRNPIIWVAHSLGGILVKRALLYSNDLQNKDQEPLRSIYVSTFGIIFLGTPHTGSNLAVWGTVLQAMSDAVVPKGIFETESVLLRTLKKDNETLQGINNHFLDIYQRFRIHMVHENFKTPIKGHKVLVVDANSAGPQLPGVTYYGIDATHSGMCKYDSADAPGYRIVSTTLREWVTEAIPFIEMRWKVEEEDRRMKTMNQMHEMRMPYMPVVPSGSGQTQQIDPRRDTILAPSLADSPAILGGQGVTPTSPDSVVHALETHPNLPHHPTAGLHNQIFIHPESFRPNFHTVGRQQEMKELHKMLMDKGRRALGTSAVLIQCLPGGGKTHLAQQYVFKHKGNYPNGVYWVQAKSLHEMEYWFWRIAKAQAIQDSVQDVAGTAASQLENSDQLVEMVREWFQTFDGWLLIFDGIRFDTPNIKRFIPDRPGTSIIYTSTDGTVSGDNSFDSPQVMELPLLSAQEAQELLLTEMNKPQPWSRDDRERALELVQLMGRLPLMIHVAAQQLKATREPLSKYLRSYPSRQKAGSLSAYRVVYDQLDSRGDQNAALNLMSILVFFDSHVPVEMIALGLHALDKRTPWRTRDVSGSKSGLANTLKVLIMFALVDRVESDDISPASSRSSRQDFDRNAEYLDILRVHSVVQAFFIEMLVEKKAHLFWLERAVTVFCRAFDDADVRIHKDPKVGLPDDYRRFQIHGRKLLGHVNRRPERKSTLEEVRCLTSLHANLKERCDLCSGFIKELSHEVAIHIVKGSNEVARSSVFERGDSRSETDSASGPESHHSSSENGGGAWTPDHDGSIGAGGGSGVDRDDDLGYQQSPTEMHLPYNPYYPQNEIDPVHFHVPYRPRLSPTPYPQGTEGGMVMPGPPSYDGDDDDSTEVPPVPSPRMPPGSATPDPPNSPPWQVVTGRNTNSKSHRTVKRNESRRYHDRAGAWRDADDPRNTMPLRRQMARDSPRSTMTFSRQTAKGIIGSDGAVVKQEHQPHQHPVVPAATSSPRGANMILSTLNRLKDAATRTPPFSPLTSPATDSALDNVIRSQAEARSDDHDPSQPARPGMNIRPKSWASVAAGTSGRRTGLEHQDETEVPTGVFSNNFLSSEPQGASPSSWTEKTQNALLRFRDQIRGRTASSGSNPASAGSGGDHESGGKNTPSPTPKARNSKTMQPPGPQEGLSRESSGNPASLHAGGSLHQSQSPRLHSPAFLGRRSAQASPAQVASGFHPPPPPPPPGSPPNELADGQTAPYSACPHFQTLPGAGPRVQRWESELQHPFRKGRGYIDSTELLEPFPPDGGEDDNEEGHALHINMSRSMPSIRDGENRLEAAPGAYNNNNGSYHHHSRHNNPTTSPGRRDRDSGQALYGYRQSPYRINVHPPEVAYSPSPPDGYTSLPMSRNPSGGSQQQQQPTRQFDRHNAGLGLRIGPAQGGGYVTGSHHHSLSPTNSPSSAVPVGGGWNNPSSPHHQRHPSYPGDAPFPRPVRQHPYQTPPMSVAGGGETHTPSDTRTEPSPARPSTSSTSRQLHPG